ncbi:hypothetical protein OIU76_000052 [Salix suchowensis]|nr:hypothetical protein OIU76_000052 [Salix suchowensis]
MQKQLTDVLADKVESLFEAGETDTWVSVRNLLESKTEVAISEFSYAVVDFKLHKSASDTKLQHLRGYARNVVERKAREAAAAGRVLMRMKDRFAKVFNHDKKSSVWTAEQNIEEIERNALSASLKILEIMAVIRLDKTADQIEHVLFSSLMDGNGSVPASRAASDPLASNAWEEVSPDATLLAPVECNSLWMQFKADIKYIMSQATSAQWWWWGRSGGSSRGTNSHDDSFEARGGSIDGESRARVGSRDERHRTGGVGDAERCRARGDWGGEIFRTANSDSGNCDDDKMDGRAAPAIGVLFLG